VRGKGILAKVATPFRLIKAVLKARAILKKLKVDVVLGMGGYASGPGGIAAYTLGLPLVIHEQNAVFGMTNRYLAKVADLVLCGFDTSIRDQQSEANTPQAKAKIQANTKAPAHAVFVGNPVRANFADILPPSTANTQSENASPCKILIVGGSLGALALNQIVPKVLAQLAQEHKLSVLHQAGKGKNKDLEQAYSDLVNLESDFTVHEFIADMHEAYAWADLVICRAGALTVAEVALAGRAAIFVPLPIAVDDHQSMNAQNLASQNAAMIIQQSHLDEHLYDALKTLITRPEQRSEMAARAKSLSQPEATQKVADFCESLTQAGAKRINKQGYSSHD
jgi:UDP-N-acetylglucosamine--N-acetylmuramyl-(pentapeptide) pyrophosphoryl-undecaprenol N-acetylglucosamine transferase